MSLVCPTVLASGEAEYVVQIRKITPFAKRIQIDLMDGDFASPVSVSLNEIWWPPSVLVDIHLMYRNPQKHLAKLLELKPHMVIVHAEILLHHMHFAAELHKEDIKAGLAVLPQTKISDVEQILHSFDHLLIFSGDLGHFGGESDLKLLGKAEEALEHHPDLEIGWDGGINDHNAKQLAEGGVDVLNAGGFIQNATNPADAYKTLQKALI